MGGGTATGGGAATGGGRSSTDAYGIAHYAVQALLTGITADGLAIGDQASGNTITWRTDEAEPYARVTFAAAGMNDLFYRGDTTKTQFYARFWVRRWSSSCSKQFKSLGRVDSVTGAYSNSTFGPSGGGYSGTGYYAQWGDAPTGGNDNNVSFLMDGSTAPDNVFHSAPPTVTYHRATKVGQATSGAWMLIEVFEKFSDDGQQNGELAIWHDGQLSLWLQHVKNSSTGAQGRESYSLANYSSSAGFYEDFKKVSVSYERPASWRFAQYSENWDDLSAGASYVRSWPNVSPAASWQPGNGLNIPVISTARSVTGQASLLVPYAATTSGQANAEVGFDLGGNFREVTCEYYEWVPANYAHRNTNSSSYNNKQFRLWPSTGYGSLEKVGASLWPVDGASSSSFQFDWDENDGAGITNRGASDPSFITASTRGTWRYVKWYAKAPTAKTTGKGVLQLWVGTSPDDLSLRLNESPDTFTTGEPHSFRFGYLMGTADSGYAQDTAFYLDRLSWTLVP